MSDLISREKVIDVLKQTGIIQDNDLGHLVVDEINRIPVVYDVEKVEAELKKEEIALEDNFGDYIFCVPTRIAIDIVKAGGIDE